MPRRYISVQTKVQALREVLYLRDQDAQDVAAKYGVTARSMYNWYRSVLDALPDILAVKRPVRRRKPRAASLDSQGGKDETVESD